MQADLDHPKKIARYTIREVLGVGAMGSVYSAWDPKMQRQVAIKVVPEHLGLRGKNRKRFEREARALAAIAHPNIVAIYDYSGDDSATPYVVIECLEGEDLYAALHRRGKMPEAIAAAIGYDLCLALEAAHAAGLVHRDLKPENVFLHRGGRVVLTDFGIVKAVRPHTTVGGYREKTEVIGTPGFMAPEQMRGRPLGPGVDIYALGALLYNIVTQRMPFAGQSPLAIYHAAQRGQYRDPRQENPELSAQFCALIRSCLQPVASARPASASAVRMALKQILSAACISDTRDDIAAYMVDAAAARRALSRRVAAAQAHMGVAGRYQSWRTRLAALCGRDRMPKWTLAACLPVALAALSLGLFVHPAAQPMAQPPAGATVPAAVRTLTGRQNQSLPQLLDNPSSLPALLRAPHPVLPGPYRQASTVPTVRPVHSDTGVALLDIRLDAAVHLFLDGQRLSQRSYAQLPLTPGLHTVDYVSVQGRHVQRILTAVAGQHIRLRVQGHRPATHLS